MRNLSRVLVLVAVVLLAYFMFLLKEQLCTAYSVIVYGVTRRGVPNRPFSTKSAFEVKFKRTVFT